MKRPVYSLTALLITTAMAAAVAASSAQAKPTRSPDASAACDKYVTPITSGYGANGKLGVEKISITQPDYVDPVEVFLPKGVRSAVPVIFFSHGYGPNTSLPYDDLIKHIVSRGTAVVFAPYPMEVTMGKRYNTLWNGMELAATNLKDRLDLTRVGFVGHSFGGGANPGMAYRGIVGKGWGSKGAFLMELAPWYTYEMPNEKLRAFPPHVLHAVQVYDKDTVNDHRMAIDLFSNYRTSVNLYFQVSSLTVQGCEITAEHSVPAGNDSVALKQYGLFRPLDALTAAAFTGKPADLSSGKNPAYDPLKIIANPKPPQAESFYGYPWTSPQNPRLPRK